MEIRLRQFAVLLAAVLLMSVTIEAWGADCGQWKKKGFWKKATVADVEACLQAGADPNARNKDSWAPLHLAVRYSKNLAVIEALLEAGADPNAWHPSSTAPAAQPSPASPKHMGTPLHRAVLSIENPSVIEALLKAGANPNARNFYEATPLHQAAWYNKNPVVIKVLLRAGADLEAVDSGGWTALHKAAVGGNSEVVRALIEAGANQMAWGRESKTPLQMAHRKNRKVLRTAWGSLSEEQKATYQARVDRARAQESGGSGGLGALIAGAAVGAIAVSGGASVEEAASAVATVAGEALQAQRNQPRARQTTTGAGDISSLTGVSGIGGAVESGPCEIPGYPNPSNPQGLGLSWCPASVDVQVRVFALAAAGAKCAVATGSSSTPAQIQARQMDVKGYCERLKSWPGNTGCVCPPGYTGGSPEDAAREARRQAEASRRQAAEEEARRRAAEEKERRQAAEKEEERRRAEEAHRLRIRENNLAVLSSGCSCISVDDETGIYTCSDQFVSPPDSTKSPCDILRK